MALFDYFKKFWLQNKLEETRSEYTLPLSDVTNLTFYTGNNVKPFTVAIYKNENDILTKIAEDDGNGRLNGTDTGILDPTTGNESTVNYTTKQVTIRWATSYLSTLTNNPILKFRYISSTREAHIELLRLLEEVFQYYKTNELDDRTKYYDPNQIPSHQIDNLGLDHNWLMDRIYSEDEAYLRRQLLFLYSLYKSKRRLDSIFFAISVINRRVNFYNLVAEKSYYDDFSKYVIFDTLTLFEVFNEATEGTQQETVAGQIQDIYDSLYAQSSSYFPTKHFLLDLALDNLNLDGYLLGTTDMATLRNYTLRVKAETQYPHFQCYLGMEAPSSYTQQQNVPFLFKLTAAEQTFSISEYRTLYTGPDSVESMAQLADGAWAILPLLMNQGYQMNSGLIFNMGLGDVETYLTYFKIGKGSHSTLTDSLGALDDPFFTSTNMTIIYDTDYYYLTLTLEEAEANTYPITEVGIFNDQNKLAFYIKHPQLYKADTHRVVYRIKLEV